MMHIELLINGNIWLVHAGDRYLKPWIIPEPEVTIIPRAKEDECLILASDGLWDVMSNEEACDAARRRILLWHKKNGVKSSSTRSDGEVDPAAQAAAEYLSKLALQKGSKDNISIIVVDLKPQRKFKSKMATWLMPWVELENLNPCDIELKKESLSVIYHHWYSPFVFIIWASRVVRDYIPCMYAPSPRWC